MRILSVVGARPQLIKAAVVSAALRRTSGLSESVIHTGQHWDPEMKDVFYQDLDIPAPDHSLELKAQEPSARLAEMVLGIEHAYVAQKADAILVYGDTTSTLAGAMVAAQRAVPLIHVEAGQRSYDKTMPEERNRVVADHLSKWLFCCAPSNVANLEKESVTRGVHLVGDVMFDAFKHYAPAARLPDCELKAGFSVMTLHRAANVDEPARLKSILQAVGQISSQVVFPVHPRTRDRMKAAGISLPPNVLPIAPVGYLQMLALLKDAAWVLTDSGGLQKEAYYAGKPCAVFRDRTEWPELVELGWAHLVDADSSLLGQAMMRSAPARSQAEPYGSGDASKKIARLLTS